MLKVIDYPVVLGIRKWGSLEMNKFGYWRPFEIEILTVICGFRPVWPTLFQDSTNEH